LRADFDVRLHTVMFRMPLQQDSYGYGSGMGMGMGGNMGTNMSMGPNAGMGMGMNMGMGMGMGMGGPMGMSPHGMEFGMMPSRWAEVRCSYRCFVVPDELCRATFSAYVGHSFVLRSATCLLVVYLSRDSATLVHYAARFSPTLSHAHSRGESQGLSTVLTGHAPIATRPYHAHGGPVPKALEPFAIRYAVAART
jgi:hypothetical protein